LIGLMHGHFDTTSDADVVEDLTGGVSVNMGIGIVVPIDHVLNFMDDAFGDDERRATRKLREDRLPVMDSADGTEKTPAAPEFTQSDFETALRKVSRKIEPKR
jgi:hypothetical protein